MWNETEQERVLKELTKCLASYFAIPSGEVESLLSDLLISLEAETLMLDKYVSNQNDSHFVFARDSVTIVAERLKSRYLLDACKSIEGEPTPEQKANVEMFYKRICELREWFINH